MRDELSIFDEAKKRGWTYNPETGEVKTANGVIPPGRCKKVSKKTGDEYEYINCNISIDNKKASFKAHRFAYWWVTGEIHSQIDHKKHYECPIYMNRFNNLRPSDNQRNQFNRPDVKGYSKVGNKWRAKITIDRKPIFLGYHKTENEARQAYLDAKKIYHT
jgi:hypothetical protein